MYFVQHTAVRADAVGSHNRNHRFVPETAFQDLDVLPGKLLPVKFVSARPKRPVDPLIYERSSICVRSGRASERSCEQFDSY